MCSLYCCQSLWSVSRLESSIVFPVQLWVWAEKCAGVVLLWSLVICSAYMLSSFQVYICVFSVSFCHCTHLLTFSNVKDDSAAAPNRGKCYLMSTGVVSTHGWMVNEDGWKWFMNKNYGWNVDEKESQMKVGWLKMINEWKIWMKYVWTMEEN